MSQGWHECNSIHRLNPHESFIHVDINVLNINELLEMHNGSAVTLFGTIFVDDIEQNHAVLVY